MYRLGLLAVVSCLKKENYSSNKGLVAQAEHGPPNLSELPGRMLCSSGDSTSNGTVTEVQVYSPDVTQHCVCGWRWPRKGIKKKVRAAPIVFSGPADGHDPSGCCQVQDRRLPFSGLHQSGSPPHPPILSAPEETPRPQPPLSSKPSKEKAGRRARGISRTTKLRGETCTQKVSSHNLTQRCQLTHQVNQLKDFLFYLHATNPLSEHGRENVSRQ